LQASLIEDENFEAIKSENFIISQNRKGRFARVLNMEYVQRDNVLLACGSQVILDSYIFNLGDINIS